MSLQSTNPSLLSRARQLDSQAWESLVDLYGPLIATWCQRSKLDSHQTADCVQEVFAAVLRYLKDYVPKKTSGSFRHWLWTITRNKIFDQWRRESLSPRAKGGSTALQEVQELASLQEMEAEPTSRLDQEQLMARAMYQIRMEVEEKTWNIFQRVMIDQIPTAIVAEEFNTQPANVRQIRCRLLNRLRQQLGDIE